MFRTALPLRLLLTPDNLWHVVVLGDLLPDDLLQRRADCLATGELASVPNDLLIARNQHRKAQPTINGWVEHHALPRRKARAKAISPSCPFRVSLPDAARSMGYGATVAQLRFVPMHTMYSTVQGQARNHRGAQINIRVYGRENGQKPVSFYDTATTSSRHPSGGVRQRRLF